MGDLKFAVRQLRKAPGFTLAAVATLALGIGANTTMFSVVDAVLLRALPYDDPGQLVSVFEAPQPGRRNSVSVGVFRDWARNAKTFEGLAAFTSVDMNLTGAGEPQRINGYRMSPNGLALLRARPIVGRTFAPDEDQPGKNTVVVLTYGLWQRLFGGDPGAIGRSLQLNGVSYTVIGVLPHAWLPSDKPEFVVPFVFPKEQLEQRDSHFLNVIGRLAPGIDTVRGQQDLLAVVDSVKALYPIWKQNWGATVVLMHEQLTGDVKPMLLVLLGAVALVLLIACANVANLLLARAAARQKELAVRLSLGASRGRVVRQLLVESLLLAVAGAVLGLALALAATPWIRSAGAAGSPRVQEIGVDWRVLGFAVFVSMLTAVVFGLAPALSASRPDLNETLKGGGRGSTQGRSRARQALIVSQVALALVLLVGAGLLVNSFVRLLDVPPGFEPRGALALSVSLPESKYPDAERRAAMTELLLERIRAMPGVESAGVSQVLPLTRPPDQLIEIPGRHGPANGAFSADLDFVVADTFRALGIPLVRGRLIDERDAAAKAQVAVVNEAFVRTHFPLEDPIGKGFDQGGKRWQIVGVVGDVRYRGLAERIRPMFFRPLVFSNSATRRLVVRTTGVAPSALVEPIRKAVLAVDPDQPIAGAQSLEEVVAASVAQRRLALSVLALFAASAVLLAALGLYSVISYTVAQRTREIGIRMAVGASRRAVQALFVRQGLRLAGLGIVVGLAGGVALTRLLATQLYGVEPTDPATFAAVAGILALVAALASLLPARRAAKVEPMRALR